MKAAAVNSLYINILWGNLYTVLHIFSGLSASALTVHSVLELKKKKSAPLAFYSSSKTFALFNVLLAFIALSATFWISNAISNLCNYVKMCCKSWYTFLPLLPWSDLRISNFQRRKINPTIFQEKLILKFFKKNESYSFSRKTNLTIFQEKWILQFFKKN